MAPVAAAPVANSPELVRERTRPLAELGTDLASPDRAVRVRAFDTLRTLSASRVADVEARLRDLRLTSDPPSAAAFNALVEVRHHMGFEGADNPVDLALGVRQLLGAQRTPGATMLQVAERLALLRGLEFMDSLAADRVMIGFFQRGWSVWQWEARHGGSPRAAHAAGAHRGAQRGQSRGAPLGGRQHPAVGRGLGGGCCSDGPPGATSRRAAGLR
ncbi:MAG: hypothetical protein IPG81_30065 [Sandaracinaceae bacterium]|nr:hypothetical protein [Sandaracinaceae bacterium]